MIDYLGQGFLDPCPSLSPHLQYFILNVLDVLYICGAYTFSLFLLLAKNLVRLLDHIVHLAVGVRVRHLIVPT